MTRPARIIGIVIVVAGLGWLGWAPVRGMYLDERAGLEDDRVKLTGEVNRYRSGTDDHVRVTGALQSYVDRTLGGEPGIPPISVAGHTTGAWYDPTTQKLNAPSLATSDIGRGRTTTLCKC